MGQDVLFQVDTGGDLDQFQSVGRELEYATFGDVDHRLSCGGRVLTAKGALLNAFEKLRRGNPVVADGDSPVDDLRSARREEGAQKGYLLCVLADVDEPTRSGE